MDATSLQGIAGMAFILAAYFQKSRAKLHGMLVLGCIFLTIYSILQNDKIFTVLNVILTVVNAVQCYRYGEKK